MDSELFDAAVECLGIHPQAVKRNGEWVYRTEWQEGWNTAVIKLLHRTNQLRDWYIKLTTDQAKAFVELLREDVLFIKIDSNITCLLAMNDTFGYGEAYAEIVPFEALPLLLSIYREFGTSGLIAWVSMQTQYEPIAELRNDKYYAALKTLL